MTETTATGGPLAGLRVIEMTHIMAGPTCGRMLADMGADVIKVERAPMGDRMRWDSTDEDDIGGQPASFMMVNRNKRGIAIDLKTVEGKAILHRLLADADVLVENHKRGTLDRLGFGYETLREKNPGLIYCAVSGFGRTGPYADRGGLDLITQGMSGLMSVTGEGPDRPPLKCGSPMTDIGAGILGAMAVCAALHHRAQTGEGQMVDTSLLEAGVTFTYWQSALVLAGAPSPGRMGTAHPLDSPYQAYEAEDGWLTLGTASEAQWRCLLDVLGLPELADDARFVDTASRMNHRFELEALFNARFRTRPRAEWLDLLDDAGIPSGPVLEIGEMHDDPQVRAREMVVAAPHSTLGDVETIGCPVKFSGTPAGVRKGAPLLGEDTRDILRGCGYDDAEIDRLAAQQVIVAA